MEIKSERMQATEPRAQPLQTQSKVVLGHNRARQSIRRGTPGPATLSTKRIGAVGATVGTVSQASSCPPAAPGSIQQSHSCVQAPQQASGPRPVSSILRFQSDWPQHADCGAGDPNIQHQNVSRWCCCDRSGVTGPHLSSHRSALPLETSPHAASTPPRSLRRSRRAAATHASLPGAFSSRTAASELRLRPGWFRA